jgi:23S rRNA (guanine2445-N2)-methyltransferase / 23S rRNA (guanine2069-N7)-methyltransferase
VFVKRRERQRGTAQYERVSGQRATLIVEEAGLLFEVNLSDYLDTGLFLDHRITRGLLGQRAADKRFLNLFCYTGTATVHAAAGGATESLSVDLSSTYLDWARRNLALNRFDTPEHRLERADVLSWLEDAPRRSERFDLIFCDPPTFSASKRMEESLDIQRDHVRIITGAARLLAEGGELVFSCNRRRFELDGEALHAAGLSAEDITAETVPPDFGRRPQIHRAWQVTKGDS